MDKGVLRLLRRALRRAQRNRVTLIAVSSSGGPTRSIALPLLFVVVAAVVAVGILGSLIASCVITASSVSSLEKQHEAKDQAIASLLSENQELRRITDSQQQRLAYLNLQFETMETQMRAICELGDEIIATLGSEVELAFDLDRWSLVTAEQPSASDAVSGLGVGGVDRKTPGYLTDRLPVVDVLAARVEAMSGVLSQDLQTFRSLKDEAASYVHRMSHTPKGWPVTGRVSSDYGARIHPIDQVTRFHDGIDIAVSTGTPVKATADGVVTSSRTQGGYGLTVVIDHGYGVETLYAHNSKLVAREGDEVKRGQVIAYSGSTGVSTGPHVHYEVRVGGRSVNPEAYLD
jgi:murein DD-endopeptidase MepM/ murein hydrolase activator NlpD